MIAMMRTRRLLAMLLPFLLGLAAAAPRARAETSMTVGDVPVDVTAKNAAQARDEAIAQAQAKAFDRLVKRLVPNPADQARVKPSLQDIESMVQDFAIENERVSPVRYIGLYSVRFRAGRVRKYLSDLGVSVTGDLQQVLILPVYHGAGGAVLWGQSNPWRISWERGGFGDGPVSLILANGDGFDTGTLPAGAAESGDTAALNALIQRYHVAGVVVAAAEPRESARGAASGLTIIATTYDATGLKGSQTLTVAPAAGEQSDKVLLRAVTATAEALEGQWKSGTTGLAGYTPPPQSETTDENAVPAMSAGTLYPVIIDLAGLRDWVRLRDKLSAIGGVQRVSLDALTRQNAAFTIDFAGDAAALQSALAGIGYALVQTTPAGADGPGGFQLRSGAPAVGTMASTATPPASPASPYPATQYAPAQYPPAQYQAPQYPPPQYAPPQSYPPQYYPPQSHPQ